MTLVRGTHRADTLYGTPLDDLILGLSGNDRLYGRQGDDNIFGGAGNDLLFGNVGLDLLFGGSGDDALRGGAGNDVLRGAAGNDVIHGGDGNDRAEGGSGQDLIHGDSGKDNISGGTGSDRLYGGGGDDQVFGNAGNDTADGGAGNDIVRGGVGNDRVYGDTGNDRLLGQAGNDVVQGGLGNDRIFGDGGNDLLRGGSGNDFIKGGAGFDTARFAGSILDYKITLNGVAKVQDLAPGMHGNDGTDTVQGVEKLSFRDFDVFLDGRNNDPLAQDNAFTTDEPDALLITASELLANDLEFDQDMLSVASIDTSDTLGNVTQNLDGSFTYDGSVAFAGLAAGETATDSFKYTVADGRGGTSTATVNVTITGVDNQAPVAALDTASGEPEGFLNFNTDFDASGSFDPDGTIAEYQFDFGDGNTLTSATPTVSHAYASEGDFTATLTVIDNEGAASAQVSFDISIRAPAPLLASFDHTPAMLVGPAPFTLDAFNTSTSADTMIVDVVWDTDDGAILTGDSVSHTYTTAGNYTLFMQITDDLGRVASAFDEVTVTLF